jgi:D-amino-acid dehydrogenase
VFRGIFVAADVVIIGGGVVGAMCARYLAKTGRSVTLVEQGTMGSLCSKGNCGYVSPSHVLPLAEPGVLFKTLKSMTTPNSPFHIRPRFDLALLGWLTNFARKCNEKDMMAAGTALNAILRSSFDEYKKVIAEDYLDCEWQHEGILFVYRKASEFEAFCKTDDMLAEKFDRPARRIVGDDALIEFEPALKPGNTGAFLYDCDAHLRPDKLMEQMRASLVSQGVTLLEGTKVEEDLAGRDRSGPCGRCRRRVVAPLPEGPPLQDPGAAGQGSFDHHEAAQNLPQDPHDLPRSPRGDHPLPDGLPYRFDHGVRGVRHDH